MKYNFIYILLIVWLLNACSQCCVDGTVFQESKKLFAEKILVNEVFSPDFVKLRAGGHADAAAGGT